MDIDKLIKETIPIYTLSKPHPVKNRPDCPLEKRYKEGLRMVLRKKLETANEKQVNELLKEFQHKVQAL